MHCYFILAGNANIPILFYVERVREGRSFLTRTVQARQRGKCIFTATISFVAEGSGGQEFLQHGWDMPHNAKDKLDRILQEEKHSDRKCTEANGASLTDKANRWPFKAKRLGIENSEHIWWPNHYRLRDLLTMKRFIGSSALPQERRPQTWLQCNGTIRGGLREHICALAYISDSYFIGAVPRVHRLERFGLHADSPSAFLRELAQEELKELSSNVKGFQSEAEQAKPSPNTHAQQPNARIGMMVSLDHAIYFHHPRDVKADDWLFSEMEVPWSGEGRGMVTQRLWNQEGRLLASCVQEVT